MSKTNKAAEYYDMGYNCSQAVLAAFSEELGITEDEALRIASGFGGGIGKGEICGAVTGALMVLGLKYGYITSEVPIDYLSSEFQAKFKEKNKTILCREILGHDLSKADELNKIMEKGLFNTICPKMVNDAVEILEKVK